MRLFFYGTLMSDGCRGHALAGLARPVGPGAIRGDLYDVHGGIFPAFVDGTGIVHGEVWEVFPGREVEALRVTDSIESYYEEEPARSMYLRERRELLDGSGSVLVYRWNQGEWGLTGRVADGRWRNGSDLPIEAA